MHYKPKVTATGRGTVKPPPDNQPPEGEPVKQPHPQPAPDDPPKKPARPEPNPPGEDEDE
jgi:hypothetical protein